MGRGRAPCCEKMGLKRGPWTPTEDMRLVAYIQKHGHGNWRALPKQAGLLRCGKSCRLRWTNYLRPDIKRGNFSPEEEEKIINLHELLGNKWSTIASHLPGRTDNEIKNVWNTHLKKRLVSRRSNPNPSANHEPKGSSSSSSSISSTSSSSHCSLSHTVEEQLDAMFKSEIPPVVANMKTENIKEDPLVELLQIPIEPDPELLDMLEDQSYHHKSIDEVSVDRNGTQQVSITNIEESVEDGKSTEWITYLENELELWPDDYTQLSLSKDVMQIKPLNPNHLYDGILDEEVDPVSIYFEKWPSASSIFNF